MMVTLPSPKRHSLNSINTNYPGAKGAEVAGFFFWQGEKDAGNAGHAAHYENNLPLSASGRQNRSDLATSAKTRLVNDP